VFFSDGVTQSGIGSEAFPSGWGRDNARDFLLEQVDNYPSISARELAQKLVKRAVEIDNDKAHDDITCGVVYFRDPRDMLVLTGPPFHAESDAELAQTFACFAGKKVLAGGTTAQIISRELSRPIKTNQSREPGAPSFSTMEGADLVAEGIITLGETAELLETGHFSEATVAKPGARPAEKIVSYFLNSDRIAFVVGTKINEAHQDPTFPVELEIRRNVIKKIETLLKTRYMKEVSVRYI
jgi:hypothetical protein